MREVAKVLFQNSESLTRFGGTRPLVANAEIIENMPSTDRAAWKEWYKQLRQVSSIPSL